MINEMTAAGMWINFPDNQRLEVEYLADSDKLRVSHYPAGSDNVAASQDVEPERYRDDGTTHPAGIFRPYGIVLSPNDSSYPVYAFFAYDVVTIKYMGDEHHYTSISACVHCSRLLDVVQREA